MGNDNVKINIDITERIKNPDFPLHMEALPHIAPLRRRRNLVEWGGCGLPKNHGSWTCSETRMRLGSNGHRAGLQAVFE